MLQIVGLQNTLQEATGKPPSLHNGQEEWGIALAGCG
jgi:hypothetical protein